MQTVREYNHKDHGHIGRVVLETDTTVVKLNGKPLPIGSIEYLLNFALQSLQDAYAGAKNADEAQAGFNKRFDRLVEGKIGVREGGGVSEETRVQRALVREILRKKLAKDVYERDYKDDDAAVDEVYAKNAAKLEGEVAARLEKLRKEREAKAKLAKSAELEL